MRGGHTPRTHDDDGAPAAQGGGGRGGRGRTAHTRLVDHGGGGVREEDAGTVDPFDPVDIPPSRPSVLSLQYHFVAPELFGAFLVFSFLSTVRVLIVRSVWLVALVCVVSANLIKKQLGVMKGSQNGKPLVFKLSLRVVRRLSLCILIINVSASVQPSIAQPQGT